MEIREILMVSEVVTKRKTDDDNNVTETNKVVLTDKDKRFKLTVEDKEKELALGDIFEFSLLLTSRQAKLL